MLSNLSFAEFWTPTENFAQISKADFISDILGHLHTALPDLTLAIFRSTNSLTAPAINLRQLTSTKETTTELLRCKSRRLEAIWIW